MFPTFFRRAYVRRLLPWLGLMVVLAVTFLVYQRGLSGPFLFDDSINITDNPYLKLDTLSMEALRAAAFSILPGISGRPVSMVSFALDYYFQGTAPYGFKRTNLIIHLLNGVLVYVLTTLFLEIYRRSKALELSDRRLQWTALAVASFWLLHPFNLTGVLYVVQRMTSLSALFVLLGLSAYFYGRLRQLDGKAGWGWIWAAFFVFTPLAVLSKENGALLPVFMLLAEGTLLKFQTNIPRTRLLLQGIFVFTVAIPTTALLIYSIIEPSWLLHGYSIRDFTLPERLMTEARVLWFYLRMILVPDISQMGLYHDDFTISRGMFSPISTLLSSAGSVGLLVAAIWLRKTHPIAAFGLLFFLLGHSIESSVIPLEIAYEHRNYLPSFGILLVIVWYLLSPSWHIGTLRIRQILTIFLMVFFAATTSIRAGQWADRFGLTMIEVQHHPESPRANIDAGYVHAVLIPAFSVEQAEANYQTALRYYQKGAELSSSDTFGLLSLIVLKQRRGIHIEEQLIQELEYRLEHKPFSASTVNSLMRLEGCITSRRCSHSPEFLARLLNASIRNPTLSGMRRSNIQFAWSNLQLKSLHDREASLVAAYKAIEAAPGDPEVRITFIKFLIELEKQGDAIKQIDLMRQRDDAKYYAGQLDELGKLATIHK